VRRSPVDVVAVAASSEASARRRPMRSGAEGLRRRFDELIADPDIHVVHNTTPNHLHGS
jgi:predicted dehydrogenase